MAVVEQDPGDTSNRGSQVGYNTGHGSAQVGREGRTTVEAEPTEPDEAGTDNNVRHGVGAEVAVVTGTTAEDKSIGKSSTTRRNVDRGTTSEIQTTHHKAPSGRVPCPAGDEIIDKGCPEENEDEGGEDAATLGSSTDGQGGSQASKHALEEHKDQIRNAR